MPERVTEQAVDPMNYVRVLRRRWKAGTAAAILVSTIAFGGLAALTITTASVTAELRLEFTAPRFLYERYSVDGAGDAERHAARIPGSVSDRAVLAGVIADLDLGVTPTDLESRISASVQPQTAIVTILAEAETETAAAVLARTVATHAVASVENMRPRFDTGAQIVEGPTVHDVRFRHAETEWLQFAVLALILGAAAGVASALLAEGVNPRLSDASAVRHELLRRASRLDQVDIITADRDVPRSIAELAREIRDQMLAASPPQSSIAISGVDSTSAPGQLADALVGRLRAQGRTAGLVRLNANDSTEIVATATEQSVEVAGAPGALDDYVGSLAFARHVAQVQKNSEASCVVTGPSLIDSSWSRALATRGHALVVVVEVTTTTKRALRSALDDLARTEAPFTLVITNPVRQGA